MKGVLNKFISNQKFLDVFGSNIFRANATIMVVIVFPYRYKLLLVIKKPETKSLIFKFIYFGWRRCCQWKVVSPDQAIYQVGQFKPFVCPIINYLEFSGGI
jgi:hypothetical protein